jgi:hypothetical protein
VQESSLRLGVGESSGGIESSSCRREAQKFVHWSIERRHKFVLQAVKYRGKTLWSNLQKFFRRENGRSEFSVENSRSPASRQISQSSRGVTTSVFKGFKLRRDRAVDPSQQESLDLVVDFHFGVSGVEGPKALYQEESRSAKSRKGGKSSCGPAPGIVSEFDISGFSGNRESGFQRSWSRVA